ncbi:MAG: septum formation initiator family protein [Clostridia bacterium]|nr:septum formation initiator family protein [Clostridia bacterium]
MRRRIKPRFWVFMIAVTLLVFGTSFIVMQHRYNQGTRQLRQAREERDALILQVSALSDELEFAQTDDYIIRMARDELGMIMPGEIRYVNGAR